MNDLKSSIKEHSFGSVYVFPESETRHSFHYTIGFQQSFAQPEILIFGLSKEVGSQILWSIKEKLQAGESLEPNRRLSGILSRGLDVMFLPVIHPIKVEYLAVARQHYKEPFQALVMLWPDENNVLPNEPYSTNTSQIQAFEIT